MDSNSSAQLPGFFPLIKQALEIYKQKWGTLITLFLLPFLAAILWLLLILAAGIGMETAGISLPSWVLFAAAAVLFFLLLIPAWGWAQCAAIIAVKERPAAGPREALRRAKPKIIPYLLTVLPLYLAAGAGLIFLSCPESLSEFGDLPAGISRPRKQARRGRDGKKPKLCARIFLKYFLAGY